MDPSRSRTLLVSATCALVMAAVIACTQQTSVAPLREDPELAAVLKARQDQEELLAASRPHALWAIEHYPDSDVLERGVVSTDTDPDGYAPARALWLKQIAKPDASAALLGNAAAFFSESDVPLAEQLLLRSRALEPNGPSPGTEGLSSWDLRLGMLYADVIARDLPYAREVREKLEQSTDAKILHGTGFALWLRERNGRDMATNARDVGQQLIERAARLDSPGSDEARAFLKNRTGERRDDVLYGPAPAPKSWSDRLAKSSGGEKLWRLTMFADQEYLHAEYLDWRARQPEGSPFRSRDPQGDKREAAAAYARSKEYARQALDLAPALEGTTEYPEAVFRAHIALGLNAFREGDRRTAVRHLREASEVPAPSGSPLESRLVNYMLKHGERETIIEYLERAALGRTAEQRATMLEAAAAIREGRMPREYQILLAGGHL